MGKKRVIQKTEKELIEETERVEQKLKAKKEAESTNVSAPKRGRIYISSTYNNTIITLTDEAGNVLCWRSAGNIGFKGTKKGTAFAASKVAQAIVILCKEMKIGEVSIFIKGIGGGRDAALKTFVSQGLEISSIRDITPIPHNGCRPPKPRRV
jgi:small subunit ribosomal protein S11